MLPSDKIRKAKPLPTLRKAKKESDRGNYTAKADLLRRLINEDPTAWIIDSREGNKNPGITHKPTGFRFHLPNNVIPPSLHNQGQESSTFIKSAKPRWAKELEELEAPHRSLDQDHRLARMRRQLMWSGVTEPDTTIFGLKRSPQFDYRKNLVTPFQFKGRNLQERITMTRGIHQNLLTEQPVLQRFLSETPNRSKKSTGMTLDRLLLRPKVMYSGGLGDAGYHTRSNMIRLPERNSLLYPNDQILRHEMGHRNNAHFGSVARGHYDLNDRLLVKRVEDHTPGIIGRHATSPAIGQTLREEATAEAMARYKTRDGRKVVPLPGAHLMRGKGAAKQTQDVVRHLQSNYMQNTYRPGAKGILDRLAVAGRKLPFAIAGFKRGFKGY